MRHDLEFSKNKMSGRKIIFIAGPSGSGKTTTLSAFQRQVLGKAAEIDIFLEEFQSNPYLQKIREPPNAFLNQLWFLERIERFILLSRSYVSILDQTPWAIVHVYARLLFESRLLKVEQLTYLEHRLSALEQFIDTQYTSKRVLRLVAPAEVLQRRAYARGDSQVLSLVWFEQVSAYFQGLPGCSLTISTNEYSVRDMIEMVQSLIDN